MDISDICINNIKADIRIVADEDHLCIPKAHYIYNVTPDIYIFIKLSNDLSTATFIGAIAPDEVNKSVENKDYYFISKEVLYNENSLKTALSKGKPQSNISVADNDIIKAESLLINFIDGDIMNNEKHFIYDVLKQSNKLRLMFKDFEHFELLSNDLAHTEEILSDSVLDVLGAQQIYNNDLSDGEFASDIDLDELADTTVADFVEEFIDENKEDEMLDNENIIDGDFEEISEETELVEEPGSLEELPTDEELASFSVMSDLEDFSDIQADDLTTVEEDEVLDLDLDETSGFEGFEGLESTPSEDISFEDLTTDDEPLEEFTLEDLVAETIDSPVEEIDAFEVETIDNETDLGAFEVETTELEELPALEEIEPIEDLTSEFIEEDSFDAFETIEETQDLSLNDVEDLSFDVETEDLTAEAESFEFEEPMSLMEAVQNEGMELTAQEELSPLDSLAEPIDFSLPELEPVEELEEVGGFAAPEDLAPSNPDLLTEDTQEEFATLDDIAQNIDFDGVDPISLDVPDLEPIEEINEITEDVDLSGFEIEPESPAETQATETSEEDDFSGLEEFTMDMASEVEKANPNLLKPQGPIENYDATQGFGLQMDDFNPSQGFTAAPEYEEPQPQSEETSGFGFEGLESFNDNSNPQQETSNSGFGEINLDDLDDFDDDDMPQESSNQGFDIPETADFDPSDIDLSEINLDDIDLSDPNLNIDNIDIDLNDMDIDNLSSLDNIPDVSSEEAQYQQNDDFMQQQMGIDEMQNEYTPDFNANDQNTIQALYEDNPQNQMPGEAMNQSFDQNQVNYSMPPQPQKKKSSPLLGLLLIVLVCAFAYMKKDLIIEKFNANKGVTVTQDQNMPIEGETEEDRQDAELLNDSAEETPPEEVMSEDKQGIGEIPGEAGGPQDIESMNESLNQKGSMAATKTVTTPPPSFTKTPEVVLSKEIKRLYWEIPQDLVYNDAVVNYLKTAGKTMKFSMQSDLLNSTESPYSTKMIVNVIIKKDGSVETVNTTVSSGSKQIDTIVLQSVKAALKYVKAPTSEFKNESYDFSLIINF